MNPWAVIGVVGFMFPSLALALAAGGQAIVDWRRGRKHRGDWDTYAYNSSVAAE